VFACKKKKTKEEAEEEYIMMKQREYICKIDMFEGRMQTKK
jgi:hypothetical protein